MCYAMVKVRSPERGRGEMRAELRYARGDGSGENGDAAPSTTTTARAEPGRRECGAGHLAVQAVAASAAGPATRFTERRLGAAVPLNAA